MAKRKTLLKRWNRAMLVAYTLTQRTDLNDVTDNQHEGFMGELKLADLELPEERRNAFHMGHWGRVFECGTSACMGGWFVLDPEMNELGLKPLYELDDRLSPMFKNETGYDALRRFFDLDEQETKDIFGSDYATRLEVFGKLADAYREKFGGRWKPQLP